MEPAQLPHHADTIDVRQAEVDHDDVRALGHRPSEPFRTTQRGGHRIARGPKSDGEDARQGWIVVDDQEATGRHRGIEHRNTVAEGSTSTVSSPPWASRKLRTMASPRPVRPVGPAVWNQSSSARLARTRKATVVAHGDGGTLALGTDEHLDVVADRAVANRVVEEVPQHLAHEGRIDAGAHRAVRNDAHRGCLLLGIDLSSHLERKLDEVDLHPLQCTHPCFDPAHVQQVDDEGARSPAPRQGGRDELGAVGGTKPLAVDLERAERCLDGGERREQIVRDRTQERDPPRVPARG